MANAEKCHAYYLKVKADPEKWAARLEYNRQAWQKTKISPDQQAARSAYAAAWNARQRKSPAGWVRVTLSTVKSRAKKRGIVFTIVAADIVTPTHCPITLLPLNYGCRSRDRSGPSLDRVRPELGYVKGNVRVISLLANVIKQDCTSPEVFDRLAAYLRNSPDAC